MLFTSPIFLLAFLPLTLVGFFLLARFGPRGVLILWLIAASMVFYAWWSPLFLIFLIVSMLANYGLGRLMQDAAGRLRRSLLVCGVAGNLAVLAYFKYVDFFIGTLNGLAGTEIGLLHVVLPLGISFFTFQKIAYLADIEAGLARSARLTDFALFVFFFPQLIAGPIVHHTEMMPQFRRIATDGKAGRLGDDETWTNLAVGATFIIIGLIKKVAIADEISPLVTPVFDAAAQGYAIGAVHAWQAALGYTVQIYFDFSGYCDIAIGLARLFGVTLPANFNSPYAATSIIDFWRRWHMTLSRFLRDYLYVPLGGNRKGPGRRYANLMLVMLLGGLWHGAGWTFVIWGGLHGFYLLVAHAWSQLRAPKLPPLLCWAITMAAVVFAWVVFRAEDVASAGNIIAGMTGLHGSHGIVPNNPDRIGAVIVALALITFATLAPNSQQIMRAYAPVLGKIDVPRQQLAQYIVWSPASRVAAGLAGLAIVAVAVLSWKTSEFLYFQF